MSKTLFTSGKLRFEQVRGVGTIETDFLPDKRVYTLIGENGVGKTKFLECLFTLLLMVNEEIRNKGRWLERDKIVFSNASIKNEKFQCGDNAVFLSKDSDILKLFINNFPIVYIPALQRSSNRDAHSNFDRLEEYEERHEKYTDRLASIFYDYKNLKTLLTNNSIQEWIIQRA